MQDTPPRRSRRRPPRDEDASLPIVPIIIGVLVLGFVIGAGLSVAGRHGWRGTDVVALPATPLPTQATFPPATPQAETSSTPQPALSERPTAAPTHGPSPVPSASPAPSRAPQVRPSVTPPALAATVRPTPRPAPPAAVAAAPSRPPQTPPSEPSVPPPAPSSAPRTAAPTVAPPTAAAPSSDEVDGEGARAAAGVVRAYLGAVARGDVDGAFARLANPPQNGSVAELGIVDPSTRIEHVQAHGDADGVTVNVDMQTAAGSYSAQYVVRRTPAGPLIVQHTIFKN